MTNWMYDPQGRLDICIVGQLSILMLIEEMELNGLKCFMSNTDGASFVVPKSKKELYVSICKNWCEKTTYSLEQTYFKKVLFQNGNSYIAQLTNGKVKKKGAFMTSTELHKNKSFRIIPLALEQYFIYNKPVANFIYEHNNIFDFVARSVGTKTYYHKDLTNNVILPKLIRYYPTKIGNGLNVMKMVREENDTNAKNTSIEPATLPKIVCNYLPKKDYEKHLKQVNREYFIDEVNYLIRCIELRKKVKKVAHNPLQMGLF